MNDTLILSTLRQRLASPLRLALLALTFASPLLFLAVSPSRRLVDPGNTFVLALILGAGMIGSDVSSGVIQLLLARPVRRSEYVLSRWLAVSVAAAGLALVQLTLACLVVALRGAALPATGQVLQLAASHVSVAFGCSAVLAALSTMAPGFGDLGLYLLSFIAAGLVQVAGGASHNHALTWIGEELGDTLTPQLDLAPLFGGAPSWYEIVAYFSSVTLSLVLAIVVMNRKQLSYASG